MSATEGDPTDADAGQAECTVIVDSERSAAVAAWLSVTGARKLLQPGASIELLGELIPAADGAPPQILAQSLRAYACSHASLACTPRASESLRGHAVICCMI
jgi:hypothetical protein